MGEQIIKRSATEQVYTLIVKKITKGEFAPGARLNIENLSKEFGVSRTPVREAIGMLTQNGFLEHIHNVGPRVPEITQQQLSDLIETNMILIDGIIPLIFRNGVADGLLEELEKINQMQRQALEEDDEEAFNQSSIKFHETIIEACPNKKLEQISKQVWKQLDAWVNIYQETSISKQLSVEQHEEIFQAFRERDQDKVLRLMKVHNAVPIGYFKNV